MKYNIRLLMLLMYIHPTLHILPIPILPIFMTRCRSHLFYGGPWHISCRYLWHCIMMVEDQIGVNVTP